MNEQEEFEFRLRLEQEGGAAATVANDPITRGAKQFATSGGTVLPGIGSGMASVVRALGGGRLLDAAGLPGTKDEADRLDAPLAATTGGKVGQVLGTAAPAALGALLPGANTYLGASLIGAGTGAAFTEGGVPDRAMGAAGGGVGGAAGLAAGRGLSNVAGKFLSSRAASQATEDARTMGVKAAQDAGYVFPPNEIKRDLPNAIANAWGGQIKTAQEASFRNQKVTNSLAARALGLAEDAPITPETLNQVRKNASVVYSEINQIGTLRADKSYFRSLDSLKGIYESAAKDFPELAKPEITSVLNSIRKEEFSAKGAVDAIRILRADSDAAFRQGNKGLAKALRGGANALEDVIERNISMRSAAVYEPAGDAATGGARQFGQTAIPERFPGNDLATLDRTPARAGMGAARMNAQGQAGATPLQEVRAARPNDLLDRFREARQTIAKSYDVESALRGENIDASAFARKLAKNKPLTGELKTIAETAANHKASTQLLRETPHPYSMVDMGMGGALSFLDPMLLSINAARPLVRGGMLSPQGQGLAGMSSPSPINGLLQGIKDPRLLRYMPQGGAVGGLLSLPTE